MHEEDLPKLHELYENGVANGVQELEIVDAVRLHELEPRVSKNAVAALWAPTAGIVCPFNLTIALAENAYTNGVEFRFNTEFTGISRNKDGWAVQTNRGILDTRYVVNAAGLYSDVIHNMAKRLARDKARRGLLYFCAGLTCCILLTMIGEILYRGLGSLTWKLVSTQSSYLQNTIGILPNILNTLYIIFVALVIALPVGVGAAVYLTEYAVSRRLVRVIEFATETLTGIPSILFGLVGMLVFLQLLGLQEGILAGGLTLVVMLTRASSPSMRVSSSCPPRPLSLPVKRRFSRPVISL